MNTIAKLTLKSAWALLLACQLVHPAGAEPFSKADADRTLADLKNYAYEADATPLRTLESMVRYSLKEIVFRNYLEEQMARFLQTEATLAAKQFICQQLWIIGSDLSLPVLQTLLADPKTAEIACYALRSNPAPKAGDVLRSTLPQASDSEKIRIINVLGERREAQSLEPLLKWIASPNLELAQSAAVALGKIGGPEAAQVLARARRAAAPDLSRTATWAYLQCAETLILRGQADAARSIYEELMRPEESNLTRRGALLGLMRLGGDKALDRVLSILQGTDGWLKAAAIANSDLLPGQGATAALAKALPRLGPADQVLMISALVRRKDPAVKPTITALMESKEPKVRLAALEALGTIGDAADVKTLLRALTAPVSPDASSATVRSLRQIQGAGVDEALLAGLTTLSPPARPALIQVLSDRRIQSATPLLLGQTRDPNAGVRQAAYIALGKLAEAKDLPALLESLLGQPDDAATQEAERAVVAVANKITDENRRTDPVLAALNREEQDTRKCVLLGILGGIANEPARQAIQRSLDYNSEQIQLTAIRELAAWPNPTALPILETVWQNPDRNKTHRVLAFRGYLRLLGLPAAGRPADQTLAMFNKAKSFATETTDQKLLLSSLSKLSSPGALQLAASYLDDKTVAEEAALATVQIAQALAQAAPNADLAPALKKVQAVSQNADLRQQAQQILQQKK
jgi:HEAT repeat protein